MIEVRRITEHGSPVFEVVVREGKGETRLASQTPAAMKWCN